MESDSVIYGLLGRIHVLMRRSINRITDVEYMRINPEYSREIVRLAQTAGNDELNDLCMKLSIAMDLFPQAPAAAPRQAATPAAESESNKPHKHESDEDDDKRYIRSLR